MEDDPQIFYFIATLLASCVGFAMAFVINRFVNKLDKKMDNFDRLIELMQEEITELKQLGSRHDVEIENLKDTVYKVRYPKK